MHNLVAAMHRTVDDLSAVRDRLGELTTEAWRAHGSRELSLGETAEPLWTTVPGALGVALRERIKLPSIAQLLEDHLALDRSLGEELRLKRQIAARLSNDMSAIEMCELARLWALQPYLDTERVAFVNALARCFVS
ncbi:hypothetical protein T492DRAFT_945653 [Pavlovales sp. CCMP2436]|nr:hypothetical protein T492DRAFT_945653 [Pavlovales sp. CCMP2436]